MTSQLPSPSGEGGAASAVTDEGQNAQIASVTETINDVTTTYSYTYDEDNRVTAMTVGDVTVSYTYDGFGRLQNRTVKNGDTVIQSNAPTYSPGNVANSTTGRVSSYNGYTYTFDDNGNILTISDGTYTTSYEYDSANQLVRENNQALSFTHTWTYDHGGNILNRKEYAYTTGELGTPTKTVDYVYGKEIWRDMITAYGENDYLPYDGMGNLRYDGTWIYTWQHGRELISMEKDGALWSFTYDANGMRTGRQCSNGYGYEYIYDGSQLVQLNIINSSGEYSLSFAYDATGKPLTVSANGYLYYYVTNLQGDVIGILDSTGTQVITYTYDAWGNVTMTGTDPIGNLNPLTYRGYVYDRETGLYYLQSRYYNPEWGRFINADAFPSTGQGLLGNNMFAYCHNNPVYFTDYNGYFLFTLVGTIVGALSSALEAAIDGKTGDEFWGEVANGAISGAATGFAADVIAVTGGSAATVVLVGAAAAGAGSISGNLVENQITGKENDYQEIAVDAMWDASFGALFGVMSGPAQSSLSQISQKGFGNYIKNQFKKETVSAVGEEILGTLTSGLGRFTIGRIIDMFASVFD